MTFVNQEYEARPLPLDIPSRPRMHRSREQGFSLIEVLIASIIFSFGLAGFTALLLTSIIESTEARRQGIASIAATNLAEHIRLYPTEVGRFIDPPAHISKICIGNRKCTPAQQADYDFRLWKLELADSIPNARGLVCRDETPTDGIKGNAHCDGTGPLVIKIFWNGGRNDVPGGSNHQRYVLEVS